MKCILCACLTSCLCTLSAMQCIHALSHPYIRQISPFLKIFLWRLVSVPFVNRPQLVQERPQLPSWLYCTVSMCFDRSKAGFTSFLLASRCDRTTTYLSALTQVQPVSVIVKYKSQRQGLLCLLYTYSPRLLASLARTTHLVPGPYPLQPKQSG